MSIYNGIQLIEYIVLALGFACAGLAICLGLRDSYKARKEFKEEFPRGMIKVEITHVLQYGRYKGWIWTTRSRFVNPDIHGLDEHVRTLLASLKEEA